MQNAGTPGPGDPPPRDAERPGVRPWVPPHMLGSPHTGLYVAFKFRFTSNGGCGEVKQCVCGSWLPQAFHHCCGPRCDTGPEVVVTSCDHVASGSQSRGSDAGFVFPRRCLSCSDRSERGSPHGDPTGRSCLCSALRRVGGAAHPVCGSSRRPTANLGGRRAPYWCY